MKRLIALGIVIVAAIIGLAVWWQHVEYGTERHVTFTVKSLDDQSNGSSGHTYLVFTADGHEYANTDSIWHGKEDSSNVQNFLTPGTTYDCPVYGYRNFFLSSYPDILDGCKVVNTFKVGAHS